MSAVLCVRCRDNVAQCRMPEPCCLPRMIAAYQEFTAMTDADIDALRERGHDDSQAVRFEYSNHRGERGQRHVVPLRIWYGTDQWHPEPGWRLQGFDLDRQAERSFNVAFIVGWEPARGAGKGD